MPFRPDPPPGLRGFAERYPPRPVGRAIPWRRRPSALFAQVCVVIWLPAMLFALGLALDRWTGCEVSEAGIIPCRVAGIDVGEALYVFCMMGWFLIITLPLMAGTILVGAVWSAAVLVRRWGRRHAAARGRSK